LVGIDFAESGSEEDIAVVDLPDTPSKESRLAMFPPTVGLLFVSLIEFRLEMRSEIAYLASV